MPWTGNAARARLIAYGLLTGTAIGAVSAGAQTALPAQPRAASRTARLTLPVLFDGAYLGDAPAAPQPDGSITLDVDRLIALLGRRVSDDLAVKIRAAASGDGTISIAALGILGVTASYDTATLEVRISIPVARQGSQSISAYERPQIEHPDAIVQSPFAATAIITARQTYRWGTAATRAGFDPVRITADIAANAGGPGGVSLFAQTDFAGGAGENTGFDRGNVVLVHDDIAHAIRYSAGDVAPLAAGFQTSPLIGGLSIERQFGTIQPFRNIRPSGRFSFVLDKPSLIDVVVNGATLRTIRLEAGQYSLRDFPFFNGLNQVELYVVDPAGRRLLVSFSEYFSARLLNKGIFEFGATGGFLERTGQQGPRYLTSRPAFTGYGRYGLTDSLTVGANLQISSNQAMGGLEVGLATGIGTFSGLAAASRYRGLGVGTSFLISYEASAPQLGPLIRPQLNLEFETTSASFTPLTQTSPVNRFRYQAQARFAAQLPAEFGIGASFAKFAGRGLEPDQTRYGATVSRRIYRFNVTASYDRLDTRGPERERRFLLTLTLPLGTNHSVRGVYDTRDHQVGVEYTKFQRDEIDTVGARAAVTRGDSGVNATGELSYNNNRFGVLLEHNIVANRDFGGVQSQETAYTVATQIALAGDTVAFGRPVGPRFAVVNAHPTLEDGIVNVRQGPGRDHPQARTGTFGPALVTAGNAFTPTDLRVDVDNLPPGYDIGPGQYDVTPGAAAGYAITVGSDASRVLIGTALDSAGKPIGLQGGSLKSLTDPAFHPVLIFSNRAGRFLAQGLSPGRYLLSLGEHEQYNAEVVVPQDSNGTVAIGAITLREGEGH